MQKMTTRDFRFSCVPDPKKSGLHFQKKNASCEYAPPTNCTVHCITSIFGSKVASAAPFLVISVQHRKKKKKKKKNAGKEWEKWIRRWMVFREATA